jgi:hypothetical protein
MQSAYNSISKLENTMAYKKKRTITPEQKEVLVARLAEARKKKGPPKYVHYAESVVALDDDHPLSLVTVRGWIKEVKEHAKAAHQDFKWGTDKKALGRYTTWKSYQNQLESYLRNGSYTSLFQGPNMERKTKFQCVAMAYYPGGRPKRIIGVFYPDVQAEWTAEMDNDERAVYGLDPLPHKGTVTRVKKSAKSKKKAK